jgi:hypothetical protein
MKYNFETRAQKTGIIGPPASDKQQVVRTLVTWQLRPEFRLVVWVSSEDNTAFLDTIGCNVITCSVREVNQIMESVIPNVLNVIWVRLNPLQEEVNPGLIVERWKFIVKKLKPQSIFIDNLRLSFPDVPGKMEAYQQIFNGHKGNLVITADSLIQAQLSFNLDFFDSWFEVEYIKKGKPYTIKKNWDDLSDVLKIGIERRPKSFLNFSFFTKKIKTENLAIG